MNEAVQETEQEQMCLLPLSLMNGVMQLIGSLPYSQVAELVTQLQEGVRVVGPPPEQEGAAPTEPATGEADGVG